MNDDDGSSSYRSGSTYTRKRKTPRRQSAINSTKKVLSNTEERWVDGVELKLFEIATYWNKFNRVVGNGMMSTGTTPRPGFPASVTTTPRPGFPAPVTFSRPGLSNQATFSRPGLMFTGTTQKPSLIVKKIF